MSMTTLEERYAENSRNERRNTNAAPEAGIDHRAAAEKDAELLGTGFLVDGVRVHPSRVAVFTGRGQS